jgi:hypothetical protein
MEKVQRESLTTLQISVIKRHHVAWNFSITRFGVDKPTLTKSPRDIHGILTPWK